jgi:hypothetical protein
LISLLQHPGEMVGLCFHGVGSPGAGVEADAAGYFVSRDLLAGRLGHPGYVSRDDARALAEAGMKARRLIR